ncbi:salutaridine reductase-like isoform X2 [Miscanthus floridulus]|uniref:salutaridine reductase-like isoform X2 n=1 Tax=Miscanthus floridulus TaxID=154761 RepID=UPI0034591751
MIINKLNRHFLCVSKTLRTLFLLFQGGRGYRREYNRGIGLEICKQLASKGVTVVLTARDEKRGAEAVKNLASQGLSNVLFHQLEVGDLSSAVRLADFIRKQYGKLDILVNNAGIVGTTTEISDPESFKQELADMDGMEKLEWIRKHTTEPYDKAKECLITNYHGTKIVTEALLPLLQFSSHGRVVNVSSHFGLLRFFSGEELKKELNNIDSLSVQRLDELSEFFLKDFKNGQLEPHGWPTEGGYPAYKVSKALANAYSRIIANKHPELCVNCVHPGYVSTDINFHTGDLMVEEGARGALILAFIPKGGMTGAYLNCTEFF